MSDQTVDVDALIHKLTSGRNNNSLVETVGGIQHYYSCLKATTALRQLQAENADLKDELLRFDPHCDEYGACVRCGTLDMRNEELQATIDRQAAQIAEYDKALNNAEARDWLSHDYGQGWLDAVSHIRARILALPQKKEG